MASKIKVYRASNLGTFSSEKTNAIINILYTFPGTVCYLINSKVGYIEVNIDESKCLLPAEFYSEDTSTVGQIKMYLTNLCTLGGFNAPTITRT